MRAADSAAMRTARAEKAEAAQGALVAAAIKAGTVGRELARVDGVGGSAGVAVAVRARAAVVGAEEAAEWERVEDQTEAETAGVWPGTQARAEDRGRSRSSRRAHTTPRRTKTRTNACETGTAQPNGRSRLGAHLSRPED
jgi:hypothetical protein